MCTPGGSLPSDCNQGAGTTHSGARLFIFASQFIAGVGTTLFNTLGITYLDDNVKKKHSPMFLGRIGVPLFVKVVFFSVEILLER